MSRQRRRSGFIRVSNCQNSTKPIIFQNRRDTYKYQTSSSQQFSPFEHSASPQKLIYSNNICKRIKKQLTGKYPQRSQELTKNNFEFTLDKKNIILSNQLKYEPQNQQISRLTISQSQQEHVRPIKKYPDTLKSSQIKYPLKQAKASTILQQELSKSKTMKTISLAQAFTQNCRRLKQRLDSQRVTFSKSARANSQSRQKSFRKQIPIKVTVKNQNKQNSIRQINHKIPLPRKIQMQSVRTQTKQLNNRKLQITNIDTNMDTKPNSLSFWVPGSRSSRNRQLLTPKKMYLDTLAKWKQLPQVVEKQKQQKKRNQLRMRLAKAKQHDRQVRKRMTSKR